MKWLISILMLPLLLQAQAESLISAKKNEPPTSEQQQPAEPRVKSPEEIQQALNEAEAQFERAKELFQPYYTGPLITPSATMVAPGQLMYQPYVFVADYYAKFDKNRSSKSLSSSLLQLHVQPVIFQTGITDMVDTLVVWGGQANWQDGQVGGGIDDATLGIGFLMQLQGPYVPQFKFTIQETFPIGKYENLSTNGLGLNATGGGSFGTTFGFTTSKVLFWATQHPVNSRLFVSYALYTPVQVENFNSYGGGFGTHGIVHPGNLLTVDLGLELSLTQEWVIATDVAYTARNRTKFNGYLGTTTKDGDVPAGIGSGFSDNLSLAPAIEYNWSDSAGVLGGAWFSVYGRESLNFVQAVLSAYAVF